MSERNASKRVVKKLNDKTPRDPSGKWRKKCDGFANELGWPRQFIWDHFDQLALCVEYEQKIERWLAEHAGYRLLRGMFDKAGLGAGDCN